MRMAAFERRTAGAVAAFFFALFASAAHAQTSAGAEGPGLPEVGSASSGYEFAERCTGPDAGAKIMDCLKRLPTAPNGYKVGTIMLPNTAAHPADAAWSTPVVLGPGVNLIGQGLFASSFNCTVAGDCLKHDASSRSGPTAHTVLPNTVYEGFTITGNGAAGQEIMHFADAQGVTIRDVAVDGAKQAGGSCIHLEDVNWWTERNEFVDVSTLYHCKTGWRFTAQKSNKYQPHPSFGYNRFLDIKANVSSDQRAFSFESNVYVYNSTFRVTINKGGAGAILFHMEDGAEYYLNETYMFGEEDGRNGYRFDLGPKTQFSYYGMINVSVDRDNVAPGAILSRFGDDAGYGPAIGMQFHNGAQWARANPIPPGSSLDPYVACGTFAGKQLVNAPAELGSDFLRVEVICSQDPGYATQIAYQMEYSPRTKNGPRVWQRLRSAGSWGQWREIMWKDQLPLAGTTGALPVTPVAAGSCLSLKAPVPGATGKMAVNVSPAVGSQAMIAGLHWDTSYVSADNMVTIPLCNTTSAAIVLHPGMVFNVRVIQ